MYLIIILSLMRKRGKNFHHLIFLTSQYWSAIMNLRLTNHGLKQSQ